MQPSDGTRPVALVTGAGRRLGATVARTLHGAGYDLVLHYRASADAIRVLCDELEAVRAGSTLAVAADLAHAEELPALVEAAVTRHGRLDALVNNAAAFLPAGLATATPRQWDAQFAVNARAPMFLAQAAAAHLKATHGAIVNMADIYAERPRADLLAYAASKAALVALTHGLAVALAPDVRVNAVAPGAILWPDTEPPAEIRAALLARTPLRRTGTPAEVAGTVLWLLRDATYTTGEVVRVDGGRGVS
jgi:pteridine reductase